MVLRLLLLGAVRSWLPEQSVEQNGLLRGLTLGTRKASVVGAVAPWAVGRLDTLFNAGVSCVAQATALHAPRRYSCECRRNSSVGELRDCLSMPVDREGE